MKFQNFLENIAFQTELWLTAKNQGSSAKEKKKMFWNRPASCRKLYYTYLYKNLKLRIPFNQFNLATILSFFFLKGKRLEI